MIKMNKIKLNNKVPLFIQVANYLKLRIREGNFAKDNKLPTIRVLSQEFGVSINVIQRAICKLEQKGYINVQHGRGIEVSNKNVQISVPFGFIQPFAMTSGFARLIIQDAVTAFNRSANFLFTDSSNNDPVIEQQLAENFIENGVAGLMIWPSSNDYNGEYFKKLSKKIPIVLVDRKMLGAELPIIIHDYLNCGKEITTCLFKEKQKKRVLVIMDNVAISSYHAMLEGLESGAKKAGKSSDLTILNFPVSKIIEKLTKGSSTDDVYMASEQIKRMIVEGNYDAVFCMQDQFIDYVLVQTGILDALPHVQLAHLIVKGSSTKSLKLIDSGSLVWSCDLSGMMFEASELLKRKVRLDGKMPNEKIIKIARQCSKSSHTFN